MEKLVTLANKLLVFDLDGTLVDSESQIGKALNIARAEFDFEELPSGRISELVGLPISHFLSDLTLTSDLEKELVSRFREILKQSILEENRIYPGALKFLNFALEKDFKLAIATSKPTYLAELVIQHSILSGMFEVIQGTEGFPAKPDPTCILRAMGRSSAHSAVMFGDRIEDINAANAAGIKSVGVAHSFHTVADLKSAGATLAFRNFEELANSEDLTHLLVG